MKTQTLFRPYNPGEIYGDLTRQFGEPIYDRVEASATSEQCVCVLFSGHRECFDMISKNSIGNPDFHP
jgi:phosphoglucomutase